MASGVLTFAYLLRVDSTRASQPKKTKVVKASWAAKKLQKPQTVAMASQFPQSRFSAWVAKCTLVSRFFSAME